MSRRIAVIVPAHRAHATLGRTLESVAAQTIADELDVIIIDDACPEGDYHDVASPFFSRLNLQLLRLPENLGAGGARQAGIDASDDPYFTCIDSDDEFASPDILEKLRDILDADAAVQRAGGELMYCSDLGQRPTDNGGGISMDGKLYRRSFTEKYGIRFNGSRSNEDYGYNLATAMLCDNEDEKIYSLPEIAVKVHKNPMSITASNGDQFAWDQRICGYVDNSIWAFDLAMKWRPGSGAVNAEILRVLLIIYAYWCIIKARAPEYADQAWEYAKKYYHRCYRKYYIPAYESMEQKLTPGITGDIFELFERQGFFSVPEWDRPPMGFDEFLKRMRSEEYDPDHIYDIWQEMSSSPEMRSRMAANEETGVCEKGYAARRTD